MEAPPDDDSPLESDVEGRYLRYRDIVGKGRFKVCYKAFDTQIGIDVAWSKISASTNHLSEQQLDAVVQDIQKGLDLDHPNIIKCFKCWENHDEHCINLITELFTSGNLRQYRNLHKHLDLKAVKRMARQILKGLSYLHSMQPPVTHGDLRCDKIYVNGHSGEIKIGDLGLATLIPYRYEANHVPLPPSMEASADIFAFGLCMLELLTLKQVDPQHCTAYHGLLNEVADEEARIFIAKCFSEPRPSAKELLDDPFLSVKKAAAPGEGLQDLNASLTASSRSLHDALPHEKRRTEDFDDQQGGAPTHFLAPGKLRGEDYNFEFHGKVKDNKMHFRLVMTQATVESPEAQPFMRTIDFIFDPDNDTADSLAAEMGKEFNLSPTDTEICAAALKEWLAKELPDSK